jgi:murein DD-endopeptidase MepM/ murein hydrolase activator NlpD
MGYRIALIIFLAGMLIVPASHVSAQDDTASGEPTVTIHVVQRGENLFRIALAYGVTVDEIALANGITNPASIQVGQRLIIPLAMPPPEIQPTIHIVQPGESLASIANVYGVALDELIAANELENPNALFVGQSILIPGSGESASVVAVTPTEVEAQTEPVAIVGPIIHIVQAGETLFRIATQYGVTVAEVQAANAISDPTLIYAGQQLTIPGTQPLLALDLPDSVTGLDLTPLVLADGQAGRLRITTSAPAVVTADFVSQAPPVVPVDNTRLSHVAFLAVPLATPAGIYPLNLTLTPDGAGPVSVTVNIQIVSGNYGSQYITLPEDRVPLLAPAVEDNEIQIIRNVTALFNVQRYFEGPLSLPAAAAMNSPFGSLRSYNSGPFDRYHTGADFAGAPGSPILAAAAGQIVLADTLNIRGITVIIDHGWGVFTSYSHMTERYVRIGDFVTAGQAIGTVGSTGRATGAHLHWELWVNGVQVDPMPWVRQAFP